MHFRSGEHSECVCSLHFEYWQFWKATLMVFSVLLFSTSQESYSQSYFKYYIRWWHVKKRVAFVQGLFCLYLGGCSHRRGNLPFSSWPKMKAKCEYALINPNSHSKRPDCGGSRRINRNGFSISPTRPQMFSATMCHTVGCPETRLYSPISVPLMFSCSFYGN